MELEGATGIPPGEASGREMEGLLERLIRFHYLMNYLLVRSGRTSEEILGELEMDVERMRDLKYKGCGEYNTPLLQTEDIRGLAKEHMETQNERILAISRGILQEVIVESNAQEMYGVILKDKLTIYKVNYYALFEGLKWCLDKGAHPTIETMYDISLLSVEECTTYEALLATVNMVEQLIAAYRKQSTEPIEIFLNPIQDQWHVREDLRTAAGAVIRAAYGTLSNCMKSGSVINMLLFMRKDDGEEDIKKCFEEADALLQRDVSDPPVTEWIKEKGKHVEEYSDAKKQEKELRWTLIKRNDNWLRRSVLHLAAIFCHDEQILNCIPKDIIKKYIEGRDINGCTPLNIAYLHENQPAIMFLKSNKARLCTKYFEKKFQEYSDVDHDTHFKKDCSNILKVKSNVWEIMKKMLVLPVQECITIENALKELFTRMVANDGFLNAEVVMGGSVREKLKVGRWDEFDLQICTKRKTYEPFECLRTHEYLVKKMAKVDKKGIPLQCAAVANPWIFLWDGDCSCKGLQISVDVVIIHVENNALTEYTRQGLIIDRSPGHQSLEHLKWRDLESDPFWNETHCRHEWDILANLPPGCRLGILICKAFLEALDQTSRPNLLKRDITSYVLKNAALWLLSGRTPKDIIERGHGNVIGERYGALRQKLHFTTNDARWMTQEDVERFAEEGRFWAVKIFDAIQFVARECRMTFGSFLEDYSNHLIKADEVIDVLVSCGRCLEQLRPEVFFDEEVSTSPGWDGSDAGLRTRLLEVINQMNEEAEKVPGGRLWRRRKEVKLLEIRIDEIDETDTRYKYLLREQKKRPEKEIDKLLMEHAGETESALLKKEEREYERLEEEMKIDKFLEELGHANHKESVLFRLRGEIEELEKDSGLVGHQPAGERDAELTRKRREYDELEKEVEALRQASMSHMEQIEQMLNNMISDNVSMDQPRISEEIKDELTTDSTKTDTTVERNRGTDSKEQGVEKSQLKISADGMADEQKTTSSKIAEGYTTVTDKLQLPGYDPSDVLQGGELDITTMDKFALLCGLPAPSALHLQVMSPSQLTKSPSISTMSTSPSTMTLSPLTISPSHSTMSPSPSTMSPSPSTMAVASSESFPAIHYVTNHYVVSCRRDGRIFLYDSLYDDQRIQQVQPQLECVYQIGGDTSNVEYLVPQSQGATLDCGPFAAANATMLLHGIDPCSVTLDPLLLRIHMFNCLNFGRVELFPTVDTTEMKNGNDDQCLRNDKVQLFPFLAAQTLDIEDESQDTKVTAELALCDEQHNKEMDSVRDDLVHSGKNDIVCDQQEAEDNKVEKLDTLLSEDDQRQVPVAESADNTEWTELFGDAAYANTHTSSENEMIPLISPWFLLVMLWRKTKQVEDKMKLG